MLNNDVIGVPPREDWTLITLLNSWTRWGQVTPPARICMDQMGMIHLSGFLANGVGNQIALLPVRFRPSLSVTMSCICTLSNGALVANRIYVNADGGMYSQLTGMAWLSLDGISYWPF